MVKFKQGAWFLLSTITHRLIDVICYYQFQPSKVDRKPIYTRIFWNNIFTGLHGTRLLQISSTILRGKTNFVTFNEIVFILTLLGWRVAQKTFQVPVFYSLPQKFLFYVLLIFTQDAWDQYRSNFIGHIKKCLRKNCFLSWYSWRIWHMTSHVV